MIEYTINLFKGKEFYKTYKTHLVPVVGDVISTSDTEVFLVDKRMLPASDVNTVLLFGTIVTG
jgi:hypothetical protein